MHAFCSPESIWLICAGLPRNTHSYLQWSMRISFQKMWFIQHAVRWLMSYSGINKNIDYSLNRKPKATVVKNRSLCHTSHGQIQVVARSCCWRYWCSRCWILQYASQYKGHWVIRKSSLTSLLGKKKKLHFVVHSNVALGFGYRKTIICCSSLCSFSHSTTPLSLIISYVRATAPQSFTGS